MKLRFRIRAPKDPKLVVVDDIVILDVSVVPREAWKQIKPHVAGEGDLRDVCRLDQNGKPAVDPAGKPMLVVAGVPSTGLPTIEALASACYFDVAGDPGGNTPFHLVGREREYMG